jgi:hypothetical protein
MSDRPIGMTSISHFLGLKTRKMVTLLLSFLLMVRECYWRELSVQCLASLDFLYFWFGDFSFYSFPFSHTCVQLYNQLSWWSLWRMRFTIQKRWSTNTGIYITRSIISAMCHIAGFIYDWDLSVTSIWAVSPFSFLDFSFSHPHVLWQNAVWQTIYKKLIVVHL